MVGCAVTTVGGVVVGGGRFELFAVVSEDAQRKFLVAQASPSTLYLPIVTTVDPGGA